MAEQTEDARLAERLVNSDEGVYNKIRGMYRTPDQYVSSPKVAEILTEAVGVRKVIELCIIILEARKLR